MEEKPFFPDSNKSQDRLGNNLEGKSISPSTKIKCLITKNHPNKVKTTLDRYKKKLNNVKFERPNETHAKRFIENKKSKLSHKM